MADSTAIKKGATSPIFRGCAKDGAGDVLDLSDAALEARFKGGPEGGPKLVKGAAVAIWPAEVDDNGDEWNYSYSWAAGDTDYPGSYQHELWATWGPGDVQKFPDRAADNPTLTIEPDLE
jgi:hypothetical protein